MATDAEIAEVDVSILGFVPTSSEIAEADVSLLGFRPTGAVIAEADVSLLVYASPCKTRLSQVLKIVRRDGTVLRFTSHDKAVSWLGESWQACGGFNPSAAESADDAKDVGNVEIVAILTSEGISAEELAAGLFDDAWFELWEVSWTTAYAHAQEPYRIAAGWLGDVSQGETSFKAEILGPGARLAQTALTDVIQPGCRYVFGLTDPRCGVDDEALAIFGVTVGSAIGRGRITATGLVDPATVGVTWESGRVRWLTGRNAGAQCEVETVDFATQVITLWKIAPFKPEPGDTFDLLPGCAKNTPACQAYGNFINYGGEEDLPGEDAMSETVGGQTDN
jgi:uncharacterized phage protein (TIGR02218 family)